MPAQEYLNYFYPGEQRKEIKELFIYKKNLTGLLNLNDFVNLKELNCFFGQITQIDLSNCNQLSEISCVNNKLESIKFPSQVETLTCLNLTNNNFPEQDLSLFSRLINLEELGIGNCELGSD